MKRKLVGFWNIELENSFWERDSTYDLSGNIINFNRDTIVLPIIIEGNPFKEYFKGKDILKDSAFFNTFWADKKNVEINIQWQNDMECKAKGIWKIISTNPDTVFFNVPNNPLHGKYAIRFFIDEQGYWGNSLIYKIELQNDSTYLICNNGNTVFSKKSVRDWVSKN
jgi:hypothetical protein